MPLVISYVVVCLKIQIENIHFFYDTYYNLIGRISKFGTSISESYYNRDFTVNLKLANKPIKTCEIDYFTIWSKKSKLFLTKIRIPSEVFYDVSKK